MEIDLKLTEEEVNVILQGLGELPGKVSFGLMLKLHKEHQEQTEAKKKPEKKK